MIKKNDVLKSKVNNWPTKVLAVVDGLYCISEPNAFDYVGGWFTLSELERYYVIPESKWEPKVGEYYYYIASDMGIGNLRWIDDETDHQRRDFLGVYLTKSLAKQALAEIKRKIKE